MALYSNEVINETAKAAFSFSKVNKPDVPTAFKTLAKDIGKYIDKECREYQMKDNENEISFLGYMPVPYDKNRDGKIPVYYRDFADQIFKRVGLKKSKERVQWSYNILDNCYYYFKKGKTKNKEDCYFIGYLDVSRIAKQQKSTSFGGFGINTNGDMTLKWKSQYNNGMAKVYFKLKCIKANNKVEKILEGSNWYAL